VPADPASTGAVLAVHGWAPYLAEALDGVLGEGPGEVVVVDDGSLEPLRLHPDHAARVRLVRRDVRGGPGAARNDGVAALGAGIELVAFCDADDAWTAGSLALRLAALDADPGAAGVHGRAVVVGPDGRPTGETWAAPERVDDAPALYARNPVLTSSVVLRRAAFGAGFDPAYPQAEDWELWLRLVAAGAALAPAPDAVVRYRRHADGLTADVLALARAQRRLHQAYAHLVAPAQRAAAEARDAAGEAAARRATGRLRGLAGRRGPYR
jgi:glycosyltransferase involved in cell wall biosynthesis